MRSSTVAKSPESAGPSRRAGRAWVGRAGWGAGLIAGLVIVGSIVVVSIGIGFVSSYGPNQMNPLESLAPPGRDHLFGTDQFGRDLLVRVCTGFRISLVVSIVAVVVAFIASTILGLAASVGSRAVQGVIMRPMDVMMSFPVVVVAVMATAVLGAGVVVVTIAIAIAYTPVLTRIVQGAAIRTQQELYIEAARVRGASWARLTLMHVLPNSIGPVLVQCFLLMGEAVLLEAGLSYLGLGVNPPTASLGLLLSEGQEFMSGSAWLVVFPGGGVFLLAFGYVLIGYGLQARLDPRSATRPSPRER